MQPITRPPMSLPGPSGRHIPGQTFTMRSRALPDCALLVRPDPRNVGSVSQADYRLIESFYFARDRETTLRNYSSKPTAIFYVTPFAPEGARRPSQS